jgi:hypothetical protein
VTELPHLAAVFMTADEPGLDATFFQAALVA